MHTTPLPLGVHTLPYRKEPLQRALQGIARADMKAAVKLSSMPNG